ncbi:hypothetical protein [Nocardia sp. NBC_00511]|uniref:hypothetical protein n=1 Tax=Nocardia sp. NBC_00511 TaxID=2903591 RepID=UPI002F914197
MPITCPWCTSTVSYDPEPDLLCRYHRAEYEGLSVAQFERRDDTENREWLDTTA